MRPKRSAKPKLGRLEKIEPGDYWQSDADFVEWLGEAENLELLSEALGLELVHTPEGEAGDGVSHLLCEDVTTASRVLVMPQVAPSGAAHLGQLITCAARTEASRLVWVTAELRPDHLQSLAWLQQLGQPRVTWDGVEVELWRIGKNAMAVNFHAVDLIPGVTQEHDAAAESNAPEAAEPAEAEAEAVETEPPVEPEPLTEEQQENLEFWAGLCHQLDRRGSVIKPGAPTPATAMGFAIARADFRLYAILDREQGSLHTELLLSGVDAHPHFYLLAHEQALVEDEIGYPLIWDDSGDHTCAIAASLPAIDLADRNRWSEFQTWFCDRLEQLYEVFYDRIKHLDAATYQPLPNYAPGPLANSFILPASGRG